MTGEGRIRGRGQANLPVLGVALVVLTLVTGTSLALAHGGLESEVRDAEQRRAAVAAADGLVSTDAPHASRANVLRRGAVERLGAQAVERAAPPLADRAYRISVAGETAVERGDPTGGTTVSRVVLLAERDDRRLTIDLTEDDAATLPRRTSELRLRVETAPDTTVDTVRLNGRVVLHDPAGVEGTTTVDASRYETTTVSVEADGENGTVDVTTYPEATEKTLLEVTVGGER